MTWILDAKWNPFTGEISLYPKYQCTISHKTEHKTVCENFKPMEGEPE